MDRTAQPRLWTFDFTLLCLASLLINGGHMVLNPAVPLYVKNGLGRGSAEVGLISSLFMFVALVARPLAGYVVDRWDRRAVLIASLVWFALSMGSHALAGTFVLLVVVRMLHGLPFSGMTTSLNTVAADLAPPQRRGEGISVFGFSQALAQAAGPSLAMGALDDGQFSRVFALAALASGIGALMALPVRYPPRAARRAPSLHLHNMLEGRIAWLGLAIVATNVGFAGIIYMVMLYAEQYGIAHASWWYICGPAGVLLSRAFAGKVFDRQGPAQTVGIGLGLIGAAMLVLGVWPSQPGFLLAALLQGLGSGIMQPTYLAMAASMCTPERRGAAVATVFAALDGGNAIGAYALGWVAAATGSMAVMFQVAAALMVVPAVLYWRRVLPDYAAKCLPFEA